MLAEMSVLSIRFSLYDLESEEMRFAVEGRAKGARLL